MNSSTYTPYKMMGYFWGQMNHVRKIIEIKKLFEASLFARTCESRSKSEFIDV